MHKLFISIYIICESIINFTKHIYYINIFDWKRSIILLRPRGHGAFSSWEIILKHSFKNVELVELTGQIKNWNSWAPGDRRYQQ